MQTETGKSKAKRLLSPVAGKKRKLPSEEWESLSEAQKKAAEAASKLADEGGTSFSQFMAPYSAMTRRNKLVVTEDPAEGSSSSSSSSSSSQVEARKASTMTMESRQSTSSYDVDTGICKCTCLPHMCTYKCTCALINAHVHL